MNAVQRTRAERPAYIIRHSDGRYLAKIAGRWRWVADRADARIFRYIGSAYRRAAREGGTVEPYDA